MDTNQLYDAACEVADFNLRWQLNAIIDNAWGDANDSFYGDADKDSAGMVSDVAWERTAASCLGSLLGEAPPEVVAWFKSQNFSW